MWDILPIVSKSLGEIFSMSISWSIASANGLKITKTELITFYSVISEV